MGQRLSWVLSKAGNRHHRTNQTKWVLDDVLNPERWDVVPVLFQHGADPFKCLSSSWNHWQMRLLPSMNVRLCNNLPMNLQWFLMFSEWFQVGSICRNPCRNSHQIFKYHDHEWWLHRAPWRWKQEEVDEVWSWKWHVGPLQPIHRIELTDHCLALQVTFKFTFFFIL